MEIAEGIAAVIVDEAADSADAGDGDAAEAEVEAATGIAVDVLTDRADAICLPLSMLLRKVIAIRAGLTAGAPMIGVQWIAGQAHQLGRGKTTSFCQASRWRNTAGVPCPCHPSHRKNTNPRSVNRISRSSQGVLRLACSLILACRDDFLEACRTGF